MGCWPRFQPAQVYDGPSDEDGVARRQTARNVRMCKGEGSEEGSTSAVPHDVCDGDEPHCSIIEATCRVFLSSYVTEETKAR